MGAVHLSVSSLQRSIDYYSNAIGLRLMAQGGARATLGVDSTRLLVLVEEPGARSSNGYAGMYHFALLVPRRIDLARWLARAVSQGVRLTGMGTTL